jgi:hypothetical protein
MVIAGEDQRDRTKHLFRWNRTEFLSIRDNRPRHLSNLDRGVRTQSGMSETWKFPLAYGFDVWCSDPTMGERVFVRQTGTFQFRHMRAKLVGELRVSASLRNVARQESDIRKTILSIPSFGLRGKPFPVHLREVEWKPG